MNLSRGICILCSSNTKVVFPPQAEGVTNLLGDILDNSIDVQKFHETSTTLKVCPSCLHDILQVAEHKGNITGFSETLKHCSLCRSDKHLISVTDWNHFDSLLESINVHKTGKCSFCLHCIKYLELLGRIKLSFLQKYPQLVLTAKDKKKHSRGNNHERTSQAQRRRLSTSPIPLDSKSGNKSIKKARNSNVFKDALKHLTPLKYSSFNIRQYVGDKKLLQQVAFVKLDAPKQTTTNGAKSKVSNKLSPKSSGDNDSSSKQPFFKIRLKLNANRSKAQNKVTKPTSKSALFLSSGGKELIVKIYKMDIKRLEQKTTDSDSDQESLLRTPTKASRKLMPEDSGKKRKNVTFADNLDTEISEGVSSSKDNTDGPPLKSSLKQGGSLSNGNSSESEEERNTSKGFLEDIVRNNDDIFNNLKGKTPKRKNSDSEDNTEEAKGDSEKKNLKKKRRIDNESDDSDTNEFENARSSEAKKMKLLDADSVEDELVEKSTDSKKSNSTDGEDITSADEPEANGSKILKSKTSKHTSDDDEDSPNKDLNTNHSDNESESNKSQQEAIKPKKLSSHFDSISMSSESSKEDALVTLEEYRKIRQSDDSSKIINPDSVEEPSDELSAESEEVTSRSDSPTGDSKKAQVTNNNSVVQVEPRKVNSADKADEESEDEYLVKKSKDYDLEEPETSKDKVSDNEIENSDVQKDTTSVTDPAKSPDDPADPHEPNVDNANTVSDSRNAGLGSKDTEPPQHAELSMDPRDVLSEKTENSDEENDNRDQNGEQGLSSAMQNGDNVAPNAENCSENFDATAIDRDPHVSATK